MTGRVKKRKRRGSKEMKRNEEMKRRDEERMRCLTDRELWDRKGFRSQTGVKEGQGRERLGRGADGVFWGRTGRTEDEEKGEERENTKEKRFSRYGRVLGRG